MLHVYFGNDVIAVRKEAFSFVSALEDDGYVLKRIDADSYERGLCANISHSVSLFEEKLVYLLDTPSKEATFEDEVEHSLEEFALSPHVFVVIEESLLAPAKKIYGKYTKHINETISSSKTTFNTFSLTDAFLRKDKKVLWLLLEEARRSGVSAEEMIGTLWWQLKTLRVVALTKTAIEAGMKDFPYNKAKRARNDFKPGEIETLSLTLLKLYHEGHSGVKDIDGALERWTLTI